MNFVKKFIFGKNILVITAHPDDETYFAAGTIAENARRGARNTILCATRGEEGSSNLPDGLNKSAVKKERKRRLLVVAKLLNVSKLVILKIPDGRVKDHQEGLYKACVALIQKDKPHVIISFGPDGITGHWDHIAVGKVSKRIAEDFSIPFYEFSLPPDFSQADFQELHFRRRAKTYLRNVTYTMPNVKIKVNSKIKRKALNFYAPQEKFGALEMKLLKAEYYRYESKHH